MRCRLVVVTTANFTVLRQRCSYPQFASCSSTTLQPFEDHHHDTFKLLLCFGDYQQYGFLNFEAGSPNIVISSVFEIAPTNATECNKTAQRAAAVVVSREANTAVTRLRERIPKITPNTYHIAAAQRFKKAGYREVWLHESLPRGSKSARRLRRNWSSREHTECLERRTGWSACDPGCHGKRQGKLKVQKLRS